MIWWWKIMFCFLVLLWIALVHGTQFLVKGVCKSDFMLIAQALSHDKWQICLSFWSRVASVFNWMLNHSMCTELCCQALLLLKSVYIDSWKALQVCHSLWHYTLGGLFSITSLLPVGVCLETLGIFAPQELQKTWLYQSNFKLTSGRQELGKNLVRFYSVFIV